MTFAHLILRSILPSEVSIAKRWPGPASYRRSRHMVRPGRRFWDINIRSLREQLHQCKQIDLFICDSWPWHFCFFIRRSGFNMRTEDLSTRSWDKVIELEMKPRCMTHWQKCNFSLNSTKNGRLLIIVVHFTIPGRAYLITLDRKGSIPSSHLCPRVSPALESTPERRAKIFNEAPAILTHLRLYMSSYCEDATAGISQAHRCVFNTNISKLTVIAIELMPKPNFLLSCLGWISCLSWISCFHESNSASECIRSAAQSMLWLDCESSRFSHRRSKI